MDLSGRGEVGSQRWKQRETQGRLFRERNQKNIEQFILANFQRLPRQKEWNYQQIAGELYYPCNVTNTKETVSVIIKPSRFSIKKYVSKLSVEAG